MQLRTALLLAVAASTILVPASAQTTNDATVVVQADRVVRRIPRTLFGTNSEWIFSGYGIWDTQRDALQPDIQRLARDLQVSLVRFPSAADGYHWRDGIGARASRPVTMASPTGPLSPNTFGTDEALAFAGSVGANLMITVNVRTGTAQEAADWVRYVNQSGAGRRVTYWELGNEPYLTWSGDPMDPAEYGRRAVEFARAMRVVDPSIKIGVVGGENYGRLDNVYPNWNQVVLRTAGPEIDFLAVHNSYMPILFDPALPDVRMAYRAMLASTQLIRANLQTLSQQIATWVPGRTVRLAVSEWGPLYHYDPSSPFVDHVKTLASALFAASLMNAYLETPSVEVTNCFKLVDNSFMGWIGLANGLYTPKAPYYALQMYTKYLERDLVVTSVASPVFGTDPVGVVDSVANAPYLEVVASRSADRRRLTLIAVNKHFDSALRTSISLQNFSPATSAAVYTLNGTAIDANTGTQLPQIPGIVWATQAVAVPDGRFNLGGPGEVRVTASSLAGVSNLMNYSFPPHSVTVIVLTAQ